MSNKWKLKADHHTKNNVEISTGNAKFYFTILTDIK